MIVGIRIAPIRKDRLVPNSMHVSPRVVEVSRIRSPSGPDSMVIIVVRKIRVVSEIFV